MERGESAAIATAGQQQAALLARIVAEFRGHALFWVISISILTISLWTQAQVKPASADGAFMLAVGFISFWISLIPALFPLVLFRLAVFDKSNSPARDFFPAVKRFLTEDGRFLRGFMMMLTIYAFISGFSRLKSLITFIYPFNWDSTFDTWDKTIHFGYRPWELLQPVLGYEPVTMLVNINYNFWFVTLTMFWLHFAFAEKSGFRRNQAILSYMFTWSVGGIALALLFSSAGPCYFDKLALGYNPYSELMTYLHAANLSWPIWAVDLQDTLWLNLMANEGLDVGKGISAMPSMHNAQCLLLVLATWHRGRLIRNMAIAHGVLVFLGSVHLGWHYAIDAYLAWAVAAVAWIAATWAARAMQNRQPAEAPAY